jgi:hypothetical protein
LGIDRTIFGSGFGALAAAISQIRIYKNGRGIWPQCGAAVNSALAGGPSQTHISHSKSAYAATQKTRHLLLT